jgi:hypothetical protein
MNRINIWGAFKNYAQNKMVLFVSKFWVSRTVRTLTIAVLHPTATETRRHPFSMPCCPFISNHVSLASCLIVVLTAHLYATAFFYYATDASFPCLPACHSFAPMCSLASLLIVVWIEMFALFVCNYFILYATAFYSNRFNTCK